MTQTGLESFERTLHETNVWLKELCEEIGTDDRQRAYRVLKGVLQSLRDRLTVEEAVQFGAQFPMLVRGFYYEGWRPAQVPLRIRTKEQFLDTVRDHLHDMLNEAPPLDVDQAVRGVFTVLSRHVSAGEVQDVRQQLPRDIRSLWPDVSAA